MELLSSSLSYCRNMQMGSLVSKAFDKTCLQELELVHNLPSSIFEPEITSHDLWFLNNQAKTFLTTAHGSKSPNYDGHKTRIKALVKQLTDEQFKQLDPGLVQILD